MSPQFKIQVMITKKPYDRPIHFKVDGSRFGTDKTVKLNVNSKYIVDVRLRPAQTLQALTIQGSSLELDEHPRQDDTSIYKADWLTTGFTKCKKGDRQTVQLLLQVQGGAEMRAQLQCKFYGEHEVQHACWGSVLSHLEYDCKLTDMGTIDVISQNFR